MTSSAEAQFVQVANELVGERGLILVDGGARNRTWDLWRLAPVCHVIGFEPNSEEHLKLVTNTTDVERLYNAVALPYRSVRYLPNALSSQVGTRPLYITEGPGACSLREPNTALIARLDQYVTGGSTLVSGFRVVRTEHVECTTLDKMAADDHIGRIDYLKLDTQGTELECLMGASQLLSERRVGFVRTEVEFMELYRGQSLFAEVDQFLRSHGFVLLDLSFGAENRVRWSQNKVRGDLGSLLFADACYALSFRDYGRFDARGATAVGLIAGELGFSSFALALLETVATVSPETRAYLKSWWEMDRRSWKRKVKDCGKDLLRRAGAMLGD